MKNESKAEESLLQDLYVSNFKDDLNGAESVSVVIARPDIAAELILPAAAKVDTSLKTEDASRKVVEVDKTGNSSEEEDQGCCVAFRRVRSHSRPVPAAGNGNKGQGQENVSFGSGTQRRAPSLSERIRRHFSRNPR